MPSFNFNQDLQVLMDMFGNCDVSIMLSGVLVKSIRGIYDQSNEMVSPYESDRLVTRPHVAVLDTAFIGVTSGHVLKLKKDNEITVKDYKLDGAPRPDGAGLTVVYLGVKI